MNCESVRSWIASGTKAQRARALRHAEACLECARIAATYAEVADALGDVGPLPESARDRWRRAAAGPAPWPSPWPRRLAAIAALLLACALGVILWTRHRQPINRLPATTGLAAPVAQVLDDLDRQVDDLRRQLDDLDRRADLLDARAQADDLWRRNAPRTKT